MSDFEWQTADDYRWTLEPEPPPKPAPKPYWRRLGLGVLLLALLAGVGHFIYQRLNTQVEEVASTVEIDLLAAHDLLVRAAANQDVELFSLRLAATDRLWRQAQLDLLAEKGLYDRSALGLEWQMSETAVTGVQLAPNLQTAEVQVDQLYLTHPSATLTETIRLQQTFFYRQDEEQGWLLAPPDARFWQGWLAHQAIYVTVTFPRRDRELGSRLTLDLDGLFHQLCRETPGIVCPRGFHLQLTLNDNLTHLRPVEPVGLRRSRWELELPAPGVIGAPEDERGYQALYRGYAALAVSALLPDLTGWQCCAQRLFYEAAQARLLHQLELRPWPLRPDDYQQMYANPRLLGDLFDYWDETTAAEIPWELLALVNFLETAAPATPAQFIRASAENQVYGRWLRRLTPDYTYRPDDLELDWLQFVYEQSSQRPAGQYPLPEQDLQLLCNASLSDRDALFYFTPDTGSWRHESPERRFNFLQPTADYEGVILGWQSSSPATGYSQILHWQQGEEHLLLHWPTRAAPFSVQAVPFADRLLFLGRDPAREPWRNVLWHAVDLNQCGDEGCRYYPLHGFPAWSPDGSRMILETDVLQLADRQGRGRDFLIVGRQPRWLTDDLIVFDQKRHGEQPAQLLVHSLTAGLQASLTPAELAAWLPADAPQWINWQFGPAAAHPDDPARLFFTLSDPQRWRWGYYLFSWQWQRGEIELLAASELELYSPELSPDGRWLLFRDGTHQRNLLVLHHLETGTQYRLLSRMRLGVNQIHWSANGRWLVRPDVNYLQLIAPLPDGQLVQEIVPHDYSSCIAAVWVNRPAD
jgi:hypothetical protein